jgi:hypothetical protein
MKFNITSTSTVDGSELPSRYGRWNSLEAAPIIHWVEAARATRMVRTEYEAEESLRLPKTEPVFMHFTKLSTVNKRFAALQ